MNTKQDKKLFEISNSGKKYNSDDLSLDNRLPYADPYCKESGAIVSVVSSNSSIMGVSRSSSISDLASSELQQYFDNLREEIFQSRLTLLKVESNINQMSFTSQMMHHLMLDLLNLAQFESGTFRINNGYFNLINLIQNSFKMLEHFSSKKNITFEIQVEGDNLCFQQIHGDEMRYQQILLNFLSNSIKFSPKHAKIIVGLKVMQKVVKCSA